MNVLTTISTISYTTYLFLGFYVFFKDTSSWTYRFFLAFSLSVAVWCFCVTWLHIGVSEATQIIWQKAAFVAALPYPFFLLACFLNLTGYINRIKHRKLIYIMLLLAPAVFMYKQATANIMFGFPDSSYWFYSAYIYASIYLIASLIILFIWGLKTKYKRIKKQVATIIYPGIILIIITTAMDVFIERNLQKSFSSAITVIWYFFAGYAMVKYNFLEINIKHATEELISNIDEQLILLDDSFIIKYISRTLTEDLGVTPAKYKDQPISQFITEYEELLGEINKMEANGIKDISCRMHLIDANRNKLLFDTKIKLLKDEFNDVTGYLMISKRLRDVSYLEKSFDITRRENDIIQRVYEGKTNKEIADELFISERTVKSHLANIYLKMSVNHRTKLIATLQELNLAPSIPSQKTLFLSLK